MEKNSLLGDQKITLYQFENLDTIFKTFTTTEFLILNEHLKRNTVSQSLADLIKNAPDQRFLLSAIVSFISRLYEERVVNYYSFTSFEIWLNQFSDYSEEEHYQIRAKIMGRYVPRDEYQCFFPIGMGKQYKGTHFITAHASPDLDTTVASFWGFVDAFAARVGEGLHIWNLPGGPPSNQAEIKFLFQDYFGQKVFHTYAKKRQKLTLCSFDLMSQKDLIRKTPQDPVLSLDHERNRNAVVVFDPEGYYLGDWRYFDVEGVRQVVTALENCLRWLEGDIHARLISFFSTETVLKKDVKPFNQLLLMEKICESEPGKDLTFRQQKALQLYLEKVLMVESGFDTTFLEFSTAMEEQSIADFMPFKEALTQLDSEEFFDEKGMIRENRPKLFTYLKRMMKALSSAFRSVRLYVERLEIALQIKSKVFGYDPKTLSYRADIEEVKTKMDGYPYLTVIYPDKSGRSIPVGVIHGLDLQKSTLGTVTLRDFCNREETKIPPFLDIISVIDHHKTALTTTAPPMVLIADAQSSNTLVASLCFAINDRYALGGQSEESIEVQLKELEKEPWTPRKSRLMQRLFQKKAICTHQKPYYVSKEREAIEYRHYLFAILDDTDLLTKVTSRDIECVATLLNRLKSLALSKEIEVIDFDDLPRDREFSRHAAKQLLQNRDLYSLYDKVYIKREAAVNENIELCLNGQENDLFSDTKIQNNCCRVGQIKLFVKNVSFLQERSDRLKEMWVGFSNDMHHHKREIDLYLQMISTISSAEELVSGKEIKHDHQDELWIYITETDLAIEHLRLFLNAFQNSPQIKENEIQVSVYGERAKYMAHIFQDAFRKCPLEIIEKKGGATHAVIRYSAGSLNSRKAMISPYLPKLIG
ncbi:MAG: hypothetical protein WDZ28_04430 [Simkaniaceae bacterium]